MGKAMKKIEKKFAIWQDRNYPYGTPYVPLDGILLQNGGLNGYKPVVFSSFSEADAEAKRLTAVAKDAPLSDGQSAPSRYSVMVYYPVFVVVYEPKNPAAAVECFVDRDGDTVGKAWKAMAFPTDADARDFIASGKYKAPSDAYLYEAADVRHYF